MIKLIKDLNFRYHLTYTSDVKKLDSAATGDKKITGTQVAGGIKFDI